ncbi:MAG: acyl--CoA ligase [Clostridia bacterium]|nr:acyl--CoA ligase [Clostridia bacterium]
MMQEMKRTENLIIKDKCLSAIGYIRNLDRVNDQNTTSLEYLGNKISRKEYWATVNKYRLAFLSLGIGKGEPVTVCMLNSPEYEFIFSALLENGSIASTVSKSFINADFKRQTIERGAKTLIINIEFVDEMIKNGTFLQLGDNSGESKLQRIIFTSSTEFMPQGLKYMQWNTDFESIISSINLPKNIEVIFPGKLFEIANTIPSISLPNDNLIDEIATFSNTGGTTGAPKCATHTHRAIISILKSHDRTVFKEFNLKEQSRSLLVIPISHITSQFYALLIRRAYGANIIYNPFSFDPEVLRETLIKERIDDVTLPFGLYYAITRKPFRNGELKIQTPCCGGEPTPYLPTKNVNERLHSAGSSSIVIGTGSTEFGSGVMGSYGIEDRTNESGYFFPYASGFLIDPKTGNEINEEGKRGILYINAPWQMQGYLNDEEATAEFFNTTKNGLKYGTNNDIAEIVGDHEGKAVYSMLGRASDFVMTKKQGMYYPGINIISGRIKNVDLDSGKFLFDMRDALLNIDGVMEAQPILLPFEDGSDDGYPVANITIRKDRTPIDVLMDIYNDYNNKQQFIPKGIILRTKFARSLSSDKREVISLLDDRTGYYWISKDRRCYRIQFPKGQEPVYELITDTDKIVCIDPPTPKSVFSSIKQ